MVLSWLVGRVFGVAMARLRAGDLRVVLALDHPDVQLTFPGQTTFAGVYRGKPVVRRWLQRFVACGFQLEPEQIIGVGPPWSTTVAARVHVWLPDGTRGLVYDNRGGHGPPTELRWGRLHRYEVVEDTSPSVAADEWIAAHHPELAAPIAVG